MAKVLQNFLIGVGLDTEKYDKGAKNVEGSLGRMRTLVGFTGAAIAGAFGVVGTAAINAGKRIDASHLAFEKFKTSPEYIYAYGRALVALNGNATDALQAISRLEEGIVARTYSADGMMPGEIELARAGVDISALRETHTGSDMLRELARQMPGLNKEQQISVQQTLGFSDAAMRSIREGVDKFDAGIARAADLLGSGFVDATEASREFNKELAEINTRFQGISDTLAEKMLPGFTDVLRSMGGFLDTHRDSINAGLDMLGENPSATALASGGGAATAAGAGLRAVGMRGLGTGLMRAGPYGMAAGAGILGYDHVTGLDWEGLWNNPGDTAKEAWEMMSGRGGKAPDASSGVKVPPPEYSSYGYNYGSAVPNVAPGSITPREPGTYGLVTPYEPVYSGGEVSNIDAANASPDVILMQDRRLQVEKPVVTPRINVQNNLEVKMDIDGRAIDSRVVDVIERRERDAMDDVTSSVNR